MRLVSNIQKKILFAKGKVEGNVSVDITYNYVDNTIFIKQHGKEIPKIRQKFKNIEGDKLQLSFPIFDERDKTLRAALVKHAYVIAFSALGYMLILDQKKILKPWVFDIINNVIFAEKKDHKLLKGVYIFDKGIIDENILGVSICKTENLTFLGIVFDIGKQNSKRVMVFLPLASDIDYEYLEVLKKKQNIDFNVLKPISALPTKEESLRYRDIF